MLEECSSSTRYNRGKERTAECQGGFIYFLVQLFRTSPSTYVPPLPVAFLLAGQKRQIFSSRLSARPMKPFLFVTFIHFIGHEKKKKKRGPSYSPNMYVHIHGESRRRVAIHSHQCSLVPLEKTFLLSFQLISVS